MLRSLAAATRRLAQWRDPVGYARSTGVRVGEDCRFVGLTIGTFGSEPYLVQIGDRVTIASGTRFVTHDGAVWLFREEYPDLEVVRPIVVGDNVFIGLNTLIMPGVRIGNNVVVGAGSIVTKDVPDDVVVAGSPARVVCTVADYRARVLERGTHVRSQPADVRRRTYESNR